MKGLNFRQLAIHTGVILFFFILASSYFSSFKEGNVELRQSDMINYKGMSKEITDFRDKNDEEPLWTNSMFGGMPAYLISTSFGMNFTSIVHKAMYTIWPRPVSHVFLYLVGFYICLLAMRKKWYVAVLGALAYAFSSYFFQIIHAGHTTKAIALGYLPLVFAGIYIVFKGNRTLLGTAIFSLFLSLMLSTQHMQIVYYGIFIFLFFGISELFFAYKNKELPKFFKKTTILIAGILLAVGVNFSNLYLVQEYGKYSIRGESELTQNKHKTSGLDKDYATQWSYGKGETLNLFIPNAYGGGAEDLRNNSETKRYFKRKGYGNAQVDGFLKNFPTYWGPQPFTEGPVYIGAIVIFLFILGMIILESRLKWWALAVVVLSILLSWGKNFMPLSDFFLEHVPLYNKFRTVSMILVIAQFIIPLIGVYAIGEIISGKIDKKKIERGLYIAAGSTMLIALLIAVAPGAFLSFEPKEYYSVEGLTNEKDIQAVEESFEQSLLALEQYKVPEDRINDFREKRYINVDYLKFPRQMGAELAVDYLESGALYKDRAQLASADAWRTFIFVLLAALAIYLYLRFKFKPLLLIGALSFFVLLDLWNVDARYLNEDAFGPKKRLSPEFMPTNADLYIKSNNKDHARVLNLSRNTFNDAITSYHHQSIGGYHGAKMKRYQELIDSCISKEMYFLQMSMRQNLALQAFITTPVLNMLNTKYVIVDPKAKPIENPWALGPVWLIDTLQVVENADEEINAMRFLRTKTNAVVDKRFSEEISNAGITVEDKMAFEKNPTDKIERISYKPNHLQYKYSTSKKRVAIFSEIYYPEGWDAYVDGKLVDHFRANYVLRGMVLPEGEHTLEFKFEPKGYAYGRIIAIICSAIIVLGLLFYGYMFYKGKEDKLLKI